MAAFKEKIKYGAVKMVEGEDGENVNLLFSSYWVEDDADARAYEIFSLVDNPLSDMCDGYPLFMFGEGNFELVQKTYGSIRRKNQPDNRLFVPVYINNERHLALIDTGASHSFISSKLVSRYSIPVKETKGYIELADTSVIERVGETENVEVVCGQNVLCAPYE
ncbi:hypothetical protein BG011_001854, partial [Mortierella polycephala]